MQKHIKRIACYSNTTDFKILIINYLTYHNNGLLLFARIGIVMTRL